MSPQILHVLGARHSWLRTAVKMIWHRIDDARENRPTATRRELPPKCPGFGDNSDGSFRRGAMRGDVRVSTCIRPRRITGFYLRVFLVSFQ